MAKKDKNPWLHTKFEINGKVIVTNPLIYKESKAINPDGNLVTVSSFETIPVKKALFEQSIQPKN